MSAFVINSYAFGGEDPDAKAYLDAVESADTQALEAAVRKAVDDFVKGLKADGIWSAIKASCILAGARTLTGALTPLAGSAPTNNNFVSGDYDRETGLLGNGSTKYLDSNRNNNADPQNNNHNCLYIHTAQTAGTGCAYIGAGITDSGSNLIGRSVTSANMVVRHRSSTVQTISGAGGSTGFVGSSRSSSSIYSFRAGGSTSSESQSSQVAHNANIHIFRRNAATNQIPTDAKISFYSIGESLDLADLDTRVSTLITDLAAAI